MRIISGRFKGRTLKPPFNLPVRPTTDFAKTGLFNLLQSRFEIENAVVFDLFAGTGSLSYEFLSRDAGMVYSVDKHPACIKFIRSMIGQMALEGKSQLYCMDVFRFLEKCTAKADIIVADAPFETTPAAALVEQIFSLGLLQPGGVLIVEHESRKEFSSLPHFRGARKYGNVTFSFYSLDEALAI